MSGPQVGFPMVPDAFAIGEIFASSSWLSSVRLRIDDSSSAGRASGGWFHTVRVAAPDRPITKSAQE